MIPSRWPFFFFFFFFGSFAVPPSRWLHALPKHLTEDVHLLAPPFLRQRIVVYSTYYATTLLLHLPLLPKSGISPTDPQRLSLARCIRAAKSISAMASSVVAAEFPPSPHLLDYSQHLLVAGGLLLLVLGGGVEDATVILQLRAEVDRCAKGLKELEKTRFAGMRACWEMLEDLRANMDPKRYVLSHCGVTVCNSRSTLSYSSLETPILPPFAAAPASDLLYDPSSAGMGDHSSAFLYPPSSTPNLPRTPSLDMLSFGGGLSPTNLPPDFFDTLFSGGLDDFSFPSGEAAFTETAAASWLDMAASEQSGLWDSFAELG